MSASSRDYYVTVGARWTARALGLLASLPLVYFLIVKGAEAIPELSWTAPNQMPLLLTWALVTIGIVVGWKWEMVGGLVAVIGAIVFGILAYLGHGMLISQTIIIPYFVAGLLFLACCRGKKLSRQE